MASAPPIDGGNSLYVGSLDPRVCTELLEEIFGLAGRVVLCRVVADRQTGASMRFGFVDYADHGTAQRALEMFNGRNVYGSAMTVDWAHAGAGAAAGRPTGVTGDDVANHYCLFIGNLSSDVTDEQLRTAFSQFGTCSSAKVARDAGAPKNHGYAFVSFRERPSAEAAIEGLDGQVLNNRPLRVDWAKTKTNAATRAAALGLPEPPVAPSVDDTRRRSALTLEAIRAQTPASNITAYVAGLSPNVTEQQLRNAFAQYGTIYELRIPESVKTARCDKLYAFVRYVDHESAARAIHDSQDGKDIGGRHVTVHWGRESVRRTPVAPMMGRPPARMGPPTGSGQTGYGSGQQGFGYGHRPSYVQQPSTSYGRGPAPGPMRHMSQMGSGAHRHRPY